ncbi:VOC family protein [Streptomyces phaeochromogenes]|uniref:VOC family protein n=1 Tax=Streptomyces phaeochromogenes TaxID=1923 RepID=UPI0036A56447
MPSAAYRRATRLLVQASSRRPIRLPILAPERAQRIHNPVDGHDVPVPHFGLILTVPAFQQLADRLRAADAEFVIEPYVRFRGQTGEQWTMFLLDPAGNALEFKAFADDSQVFAA